MPGKPELLCPHCHSDDVRRVGYSPAAFAINMLLVSLPLALRPKKFHCFGCGKDFKPAKTVVGS